MNNFPDPTENGYVKSLKEAAKRIATPRAFFSRTLESNSSDVTGLTLHAQTYTQKNATVV